MFEVRLSDISKYLTEDVIDKAFKINTGSDDIVKSINITRAAPAGEGLLSAVYRIHVTGQTHTASFVVKSLVNDLVLRNSLDCPKYFKREGEFFTIVLPVLAKFQKSTGAKENIEDNVPKCYSCHLDGVNDYILFEDLAETNCFSVSQHPTEEERNQVLKALAHFHATSIALRIKHPEEFNKIANCLDELYYTESTREYYSPYLENAIQIDSKALGEYEDSKSIYMKKFNSAVKNDVFGQIIATVTNFGENPVVCHGDAWCPNFMYSKNRAVMIDFQLARCASPATDLAYLIMMCSNLCKTKANFIEAVEVYYNALDYYLNDMGLDSNKVIPRNNLWEELKIFGKYGVLCCLTSIPLLAGERYDTLKSLQERFPGMEKVPLEDIWKLVPIENNEYKQCLVNVVRVAVDVGLL